MVSGIVCKIVYHSSLFSGTRGGWDVDKLVLNEVEIGLSFE